jgi:protein-disulfide isomerase
MKRWLFGWSLPFAMFTFLTAASSQTIAQSDTATTPNSRLYLTEEDVRRIVREELASIQQDDRKNDLASLLRQYHLANENTETMKYGNLSARFTLQMFSDIECPFCRQMYFDVKKVVDHAEGIINWEYKHFPLSGHNPVAAIEAQAIECIASEQGNKKAWVALEQFIKSTQGNGQGVQQDLPDFVRSFGLNGSLLKNCLLTDESKISVNEDYGLGRALGVTATPAVLLKDNLNNKDYLIKGMKSAEQILEAIQRLM